MSTIPTRPVTRPGSVPGPASERRRLAALRPRLTVRRAPAPVQARTAPAAVASVRDWTPVEPVA